MTAVGWLPADVEDLFGAQATAEEAYDVLTVDVPSDAWIPALEAARDRLGCTFFDWLSAVDEPGTGLGHFQLQAPRQRRARPCAGLQQHVRGGLAESLGRPERTAHQVRRRRQARGRHRDSAALISRPSGRH